MIDLETMKEERLLKPAEVAEILSVSKPLVYRLIKQGLIQAVRINHAVRVKRSDLYAFIERCRTELNQTYPL